MKNIILTVCAHFLQAYYGRLTVGYELLVNGYFSVDSFFFMSGFLVAYFSFIEMEKGRLNIVLYYVHRFIR